MPRPGRRTIESNQPRGLLLVTFRRRAALALALLSAGCGEPTAPPPLPAGAAPMTRPVVYAAWWEMVKACSGVSGDLERVSWYSAPPANPEEGGGFEVDGEEYDGYWYESGHRIVVLDSRRLDGPVVRHEMLHELLRRGNHPREAFVGSCAGVVNCRDGCDTLGESGRGVPEGAREVAPAALEISIVATPAAPSASTYGGWFTLTVSARNPAAEPVWVRLPSDVAFGYLALTNGYSGTYRPTSDSRMAFRAGETRREVFDLNLYQQYPPGIYSFSGIFGWQESPAITVNVGP
jgi:hypothetical protein